MKNHCCHSFADLFHAAFGREPERTELDELYALSQDERNRVVKEWAKLADWETKEVVGTDGVEYVSFGERMKAET